MTRPHIVRADSIDLQDPEQPSAQDHSRSNHTHGVSGLGSHQAETLREVAQETAEEKLRSPRVSWTNGDSVGDLQQYAEHLTAGVTDSFNAQQNGYGDGNMEQQDALAVAQNGGMQDDSDLDDVDADDGMDDDMNGGISSSPSIEDGASYPALIPLPSCWPRRVSSLPRGLHDSSRASSSTTHSQQSSTSTFTAPGARTPTPPSPQSPSPHSTETEKQQSSGKDTTQAITVHHHLHPQDEPDAENETPDAEPDIERAGMRGDKKDGEESEDMDEFYKKRLELERDEGEAMCNIDDDEDLFIPYDGDPADDDGSEMSFPDDEMYIGSGWSHDCLQDTEDIDFEFVYALHTFVATVEGQANATKGDTMVLLDDSNSYWWLVRVVKDSSIGYLPAEHIETPTERLARLNKHRNIDLSATMLGDQAEKSKTGFKSAIRRRKKTVTFAAPTIVNYPDIDYSSSDEDPEELFAQQQHAARLAREQEEQQAAQQAADEDMVDETAKVEPLKPRATKDLKTSDSAKDNSKDDFDKRASEDMFDGKADGVSRSRNGTVRNTDSFFKDDTVETKKITLTPNLLRDDDTPRASSDSKELRQRPSLDRVDKELLLDKGKDDKKKKDKDKKEKDKKPSAIRSFFSRKDKKNKSGVEEEDELAGKRSIDMATTESQAREEEFDDPEKGGLLQRNPSKLQKQQPRTEPSPTRKNSTSSQKSPAMELASYLSETRNDVSNVPPSSMRIVEEEEPEDESPLIKPEDSRVAAAASNNGSNGQAALDDKSRGMLGASNAKTDPSRTGPQSTRDRHLDDYDDTQAEASANDPAARLAQEKQRREQQKQQQQQEKALRPTLPGAFPDSFASTQTTSTVESDKTAKASVQQPADRLSESPGEVSPVNASKPPGLMADTSSQEEHSESPSPELMDAADASKDVTISSQTSSNAAWNDAKLRHFFDSSSDIRDMLVVVYDKTDVAPAGPDHPIAGPLFREQNAKLAEITTQLDNMLGDWLARKQRLRGTV